MGITTPKQIRCLERYGFRKVGTWRFSEASSVISRLADNHWRVLYGIAPKSQGMKQLMAGGGVALIGLTLVPLLSGLFG